MGSHSAFWKRFRIIKQKNFLIVVVNVEIASNFLSMLFAFPFIHSNDVRPFNNPPSSRKNVIPVKNEMNPDSFDKILDQHQFAHHCGYQYKIKTFENSNKRKILKGKRAFEIQI